MPMSPGLLSMMGPGGLYGGQDPRDPRAQRRPPPFNPYPQAPQAPLVQPRPVEYLPGQAGAQQDPMQSLQQQALQFQQQQLARKRREAPGGAAEFNPAGVSPWMSWLGGLGGLGGGGGGAAA